jgi:type I restriction enzyme S subunit
MGRYDLPKGWEWRRLGDKQYFVVIMGQSPPSSSYNLNSIGSPFFQGKAEFGALHPVAKKYCTTPSRIAEKDDVLISVRAPVGPTNLADKKCCIGRGLAAIRCKNKVLPLYLLLSLRNIENDIAASVQDQGGGFTAIKREQLENVEIPIPPMPEQRRIVKRIEELTRRIEESRKIIAANLGDMSRLLPSAMEDCFHGDNGWIEKPLRELCVMKTGKTPPTSHPEYFDGDIPFVCPADVGERLLISDAQRRLSENALKDRKATVFEKGAVLLVCIGSTVGKVGLAARKLCTNQQITGLVFNDDVLPEYAAWFLNQQRETIRNAAAGGGVPIINQNGVGQLSMRFPEDKTEQSRIIEYLNILQNKAEELRQLQTETEAELATFTPALLSKAFRGEL